MLWLLPNYKRGFGEVTAQNLLVGFRPAHDRQWSQQRSLNWMQTTVPESVFIFTNAMLFGWQIFCISIMRDYFYRNVAIWEWVLCQYSWLKSLQYIVMSQYTWIRIHSHLTQPNVSVDHLRITGLCRVLPPRLLFHKSTLRGEPRHGHSLLRYNSLLRDDSSLLFPLFQIETNKQKSSPDSPFDMTHTSVQNKQLGEIFHQDLWNQHEVTALNSRYLLISSQKQC